ncbi:MAG TPA: rhodanese-like domain-containing protein [Flavipsychrobacter sp.]
MGFFSSLLGNKSDSKLSEVIQAGAYLVDVRTPAEFAMGSVKGAENIPLDSIPGQLSKFKGKESIVVFCRSGARSSQAKSLLEQNGIQNVINGGAWTNVQSAVK